MRTPTENKKVLREPHFLAKAAELNTYLRSLTENEIAKVMKIKPDLAHKTKLQIENWSSDPTFQMTAIDTFLGDIYSGFQASRLDEQDRKFADGCLIILSGLYGMIKPLDGIMPYRLEMAYKLLGFKTPNLYKFWGDKITQQIPENEVILNLSSVEYSKVITDYVDGSRFVTPKFLTINSSTKEPTFVVVHAKIARGAFARWVIQNRIDKTEALQNFNELGYTFDEKLSTKFVPVFVCQTFEGLGLSVRLS